MPRLLETKVPWGFKFITFLARLLIKRYRYKCTPYARVARSNTLQKKGIDVALVPSQQENLTKASYGHYKSGRVETAGCEKGVYSGRWVVRYACCYADEKRNPGGEEAEMEVQVLSTSGDT
jgi:hypothetical protein